MCGLCSGLCLWREGGRRLVTGCGGKGEGRELVGESYCRRVFDQIIVRALWRHE